MRSVKPRSTTFHIPGNEYLIYAFTYRDMGCAIHEYILRIFRNGWMDCRDAFHAALCL